MTGSPFSAVFMLAAMTAVFGCSNGHREDTDRANPPDSSATTESDNATDTTEQPERNADRFVQELAGTWHRIAPQEIELRRRDVPQEVKQLWRRNGLEGSELVKHQESVVAHVPSPTPPPITLILTSNRSDRLGGHKLYEGKLIGAEEEKEIRYYVSRGLSMENRQLYEAELSMATSVDDRSRVVAKFEGLQDTRYLNVIVGSINSSLYVIQGEPAHRIALEWVPPTSTSAAAHVDVSSAVLAGTYTRIPSENGKAEEHRRNAARESDAGR